MNPAAGNVITNGKSFNSKKIFESTIFFSYHYHLIKKDILLEIRQQYTFYGIALYVASTIFVVFLTLDTPEDKVWNSLFWVIQLFVCVNAVAKSFLQENKGRLFYFYSIAGASQFILAKLVVQCHF